MDPHDTYTPDLITRYLSGEASPEEVSALSEWIRSAPAHAAQFDELRRTWLNVISDQVDQLDLDREWNTVALKLKGIRDPGSGIRNVQYGMREAQYTKRETRSAKRETRIAKRETRIAKPETEPKLIPLQSGRHSWQVILIRTALVAAIALVLLIPTWVAYRYFTRTEMVQVTASSEILETTLPDGTTVTLNAFARLNYPEDFGTSSRNAGLIGEGYFEVSTDSLTPFILSCSSSRIEVLGTSFYVDASRPDQQVEVILVEGSVSVYFDDKRSTGKTIIPGEKASLSETSQRIVVTPNVDPNFLAWKSFHLVFLDDPLDMILQTLNKVYQSNIVVANERLNSCRLTATFDRQSLESVLSVITATLDLQAETTPDGIVLFGNGCD